MFPKPWVLYGLHFPSVFKKYRSLERGLTQTAGLWDPDPPEGREKGIIDVSESALAGGDERGRDGVEFLSFILI